MEQKELSTTEINNLTAEILILKQQTAQSMIEIGKRLIIVKESLPHGEWGKWLEERVDFKQTTASKFMRVAKEFSNLHTYENLTQSKIFALLDVPEDEREEFIENNPVDEMTTRELQQAIKERKELEESNKILEQSFNDLSKKYSEEVSKPPITVEVDTKLGRRNLTPIQKIAIAEKYRPIYEKRAQEKMKEGINQYSPCQKSDKPPC